MQVVLDIEDRMVCPYRCIHPYCNYTNEDCYCPWVMASQYD